MLARCGLVFTVALLLAAEPAKEDTALKETLVKQERKLIDALQKKDATTLKRMLADESLAITPYSGRVTGAQQLATLADLEVTSYTLTDAKAVAVTKDVAILSYVLTSKGKFKGKDLSGKPVYATSIWALRDGQWRSVFYQETVVEK